MSRARRRLLFILCTIPAVLLLAAFLYRAGMERLEGRPRDFWSSLEWASETLTTTGYGHDAHWRHPAMVLFVIVMQFGGVALVYLLFPVYLIPYLEERFQTRIDRTAPDLRDHVIIHRYGPAVTTLLTELKQRGVPTLVIEQDVEQARRLKERGTRVILCEPGDPDLLGANLSRARALVLNAGDADNVSTVLAARQLGFTGEVLALTETPFHRPAMLLAGASAAFLPRHVLGAALAARASEKISPRVAGIQGLGDRLSVREMRIQRDSPLSGCSLGELGIGARTGATIIGQWEGGKLISPPTAETRFCVGGIIVAVGSPESLGRLEELARGAVALRKDGPFIICGNGEVGGKVAELLRMTGEKVFVIDQRSGEGVDLLGNVAEERVLRQAPLGQARAVILALDGDSSAVLAAVLIRGQMPDLPLIARVNQPENIGRLHRAGVDFALSLGDVSGQLVAGRLLREEAVSMTTDLKVLRQPAEALAGRTLAELRLRARTGCSVVAVERAGEVMLDLHHGFRFAPGDVAYVSGGSDAVARFANLYSASRKNQAKIAVDNA